MHLPGTACVHHDLFTFTGFTSSLHHIEGKNDWACIPWLLLIPEMHTGSRMASPGLDIGYRIAPAGFSDRILGHHFQLVIFASRH